ncbi:Protein bicaudal C 1 [Cichlidogyrus casuarinus]|uniref:Protein bicaudal C 1 n=1 Tax=Cichlidogyrus casuarinus TaxID=1844966 RepID=A0ABD2QJZ0_9PLAT
MQSKNSNSFLGMQLPITSTGFFSNPNSLAPFGNLQQELGLHSRLFCDSICNPQQLKRRVNLLVDVSHLHHSHVIGKGGRNVKSISEQTKCNIHFPDSNRANIPEKSNQVFISGPVPGINEAREIIRSMLPFYVSFQVAIANDCFPSTTQFLRLVENRYSVEIFLSQLTSLGPNSNLHSVTVNVKALSFQLNSLEEATTVLLRQLFKEDFDKVRIRTCIEIDPRHQERMLAAPRNIVREIILSTGCEIHFPESKRDSNFYECPTEKSTVILSGTREGIFRARKFVMDNLPVKMSFDITEDEFNCVQIMDPNDIRTKFGVAISVKCHRKYEQRRNVQVFTTENNMLGLIGFYNSVIERTKIMYLNGDNKDSPSLSISRSLWNPGLMESSCCSMSSSNEDKENCWITQNLFKCMDEKNE